MDWGTIKYGVPQASVLGTLLIIININDFPLGINTDSRLMLFADDTCINHCDLLKWTGNKIYIHTELYESMICSEWIIPKYREDKCITFQISKMNHFKFVVPCKEIKEIIWTGVWQTYQMEHSCGGNNNKNE